MKPDTLNLYGALTFPRTKRVALIGALLGCAALIPARAGTPEAAAEFGGQCVEGLSQGRHITTKCAETLPHRFLGGPKRRTAQGAGDPHLQGADQGRGVVDVDGTLTGALVVDPGLRAPRTHGHQAGLGGDVGG